MRVLFVEDNTKLGEATRKSLIRTGFAVDLFQTPEDGWHAWQMAPYDVVILDIMLARHNALESQSGLDLLARIRAAGISTPVLLLTALGSVNERVRGLNAGADDYLVKPFAMEELVARLKALGRRPIPLAEEVIRYGDVVYDIPSRELAVGDGRAVRKAVNAITVSHRTDHGTTSKAGLPKGRDATAGRLHNDTAYGLTGEVDGKGNGIVVHRVTIDSIRNAADIGRIRDDVLKAAIHRFTEGLEGKAFEAAIRRFPELGPLPFRGVRRVRVTEPLAVIPIRDAQGRAYKGYKGDSNYRYDVWELPDGSWVTSWKDRDGKGFSSIVSMFDAHQSQDQPRPHPAARKVLSLHQNDLLAIERDGDARRLMRVVKFGQNGQITLAEPQQAGDLKRRDAKPNDEDPFKYFAPTCGGLKKAKARQVRIDEIGRVLDPGFPARTMVRRTRHGSRAAE